MAVREILKMGDPRLLRQAEPVGKFGTRELDELIADMFDTMHDANGAGLAAPQIGVNLQIVIFGFKKTQRYPDAPPVPETVLLNPVLTVLSDVMEEDWEGCLSVPGLRGVVSRHAQLRYQGFDQYGNVIDREMTNTEFSQYQKDQAETEALKAEIEAKAQAKLAAQAKLEALGLTVEDLQALGL